MRRKDGSIIPTAVWATEPNGRRRAGERVLDDALRDVGDASRERQFRMPITLCRHRALRAEEVTNLPTWWHKAPALDVAGPPLEIQWSKGIKESLSLQPCRSPREEPVGGDPLIYYIIPCEACDSCDARRKV
jgi:hypothetical protein